MDHFGIGAAIQGAARIYIQSARRSGRTQSLIDSVKDGDRIIFMNRNEADRVKRLCLERDVKIECLVINPREPGLAYERGSSKGRTIFDHQWIEEYYLLTIGRAMKDIDHIESQLSGDGFPHRETRRKAEEIAKWQAW